MFNSYVGLPDTSATRIHEMELREPYLHVGNCSDIHLGNGAWIMYKMTTKNLSNLKGMLWNVDTRSTQWWLIIYIYISKYMYMYMYIYIYVYMYMYISLSLCLIGIFLDTHDFQICDRFNAYLYMPYGYVWKWVDFPKWQYQWKKGEMILTKKKLGGPYFQPNHAKPTCQDGILC